MPELKDILGLCREYGWRDVGPTHDLMAWLRKRLETGEPPSPRDLAEKELSDTKNKLRNAEIEIDSAASDLRCAEMRHTELKRKLDDLQKKYPWAAPKKSDEKAARS